MLDEPMPTTDPSQASYLANSLDLVRFGSVYLLSRFIVGLFHT